MHLTGWRFRLQLELRFHCFSGRNAIWLFQELKVLGENCIEVEHIVSKYLKGALVLVIFAEVQIVVLFKDHFDKRLFLLAGHAMFNFLCFEFLLEVKGSNLLFKHRLFASHRHFLLNTITQHFGDPCG
jgi:hypothetical protein